MENTLFSQKGIVFVVSAPSGAGKSTLLNEVIKQDDNIKYSISHTTRDPRGEEKNGEHYFFVNVDEFKKMIADDVFVEYAQVYDNYYGTSAAYLKQEKAKGHDLILDIDTEGASLIKDKVETVSIFIIPPSMQELSNRLNARGTDTAEVIAKRQALVLEELSCIKNYDYVVVNDKIEKAVQSLLSIINAERSRLSKQDVQIAADVKKFMGE